MNKHNSIATAEKKKLKYNCNLRWEKAEMSPCD